jgi:hypothetical protein
VSPTKIIDRRTTADVAGRHRHVPAVFDCRRRRQISFPLTGPSCGHHANFISCDAAASREAISGSPQILSVRSAAQSGLPFSQRLVVITPRSLARGKIWANVVEALSASCDVSANECRQVLVINAHRRVSEGREGTSSSSLRPSDVLFRRGCVVAAAGNCGLITLLL